MQRFSSTKRRSVDTRKWWRFCRRRHKTSCSRQVQIKVRWMWVKYWIENEIRRWLLTDGCMRCFKSVDRWKKLNLNIKIPWEGFIDYLFSCKYKITVLLFVLLFSYLFIAARDMSHTYGRELGSDLEARHEDGELLLAGFFISFKKVFFDAFRVRFGLPFAPRESRF